MTKVSITEAYFVYPAFWLTAIYLAWFVSGETSHTAAVVYFGYCTQTEILAKH